MATEKRIAELEIKLKGAKTLGELETTLEDINKELKDVDKNGKAFQDLAGLARQADAEVSELNLSLEGVTSQEKTDAALKLGEALVGGFAIASVAASAFGEEAGESVEEATAAAGQLLVVLDGVNKISQAFSAESIKGLKGIVSGFKSSAVGAKLFGNASRAALTVAGIGVLVGLLGVVIENWDSISAKVTEFGQKALNALKTVSPPLNLIISFVENLTEKVGSLSALFEGLAASISAIFSGDFDKVGEAFDEAVEKQQELERATEEYNKFQTEISDELQFQIDLMEEQGATQDEINAKKREALVLEADLLRAISERTDEQEERLKELDRELQLFDARLERQREELEEQKRINAEKERQRVIEEQLLAQKERSQALDKERSSILNLINRQIELASSRQEKITLLQQRSKVLNEDLLLTEELLAKAQERREKLSQNEEKNKTSIIILNAEIAALQLQILNTGEKIRTTENNITNLFVQKAKGVEAINTGLEQQLVNTTKIQKVNVQIVQELTKFQAIFGRISDGYDNFVTDVTSFTQEFAFEIQTAVQGINQLFDVLAANRANEIEKLQIELDQINEQISDAENASDRAKDDLRELEDLANDVNGARLAGIQEEIVAEQEKVDAQIANEDALKAKRDQIEAELKKQKENDFKANKKAQQIQAAIAGALAIVQSLANTVLPFPASLAAPAVIAGLTAAQIGAIGGQPVPKFAEGGFTQGLGVKDSTGHEVAGVVHGGEWVANADMVASNKSLFMALEGVQRGLRGFADGGFVNSRTPTPSDIPSFNNDMSSALQNANITVSVKEINDVSTNVRVLEQRASV